MTTIRKIQDAVCELYGITRDDLLGRRKPRRLVRVRHVAMYLAYQLTMATSTQVGRSFKRDHSTVVYAVKRVSDLMSEQKSPEGVWIRTIVEALVNHLEQPTIYELVDQAKAELHA